MSLYAELKRRNVIRVAAAYVVTAWLIIQVVETIFPAFGFGDAAVRIATIVLGIGLVPTLILAWVFELTPEGLRKDRDVDHTLLVSVQAGKRLDRIILVVLAVALGYFAFDKFVLDPARDAEELATVAEEARQEGRSEALVETYGDKSIAVLPFVNMSADPEQEYFSDGISEELLNLLGQRPQIRVTARTSSFSFKGKDVTIKEIAKELNVAHILEGSVRKSGNRVRITAQLIEARSDTHLWSETYDRELEDIFAIQDEVASAISLALELELALSGEQAPASITTASTRAYDDFLRGRELIHRRDQYSLEDAIRLLERSLRLDKNYAPAHAQLAIAKLLLVRSKPSTWEELRQSVVSHLDRAQELAPGLVEAHGGKALLASFSYDYESAVIHAKEALELNPNYVDGMSWLAVGYEYLGRYKEADAVQRQATLTDPLNRIALYNTSYTLALNGQIEKAGRMADRLLRQDLAMGNVLHARISMIEGAIAERLHWGFKYRIETGDNNQIIFAFIAAGEYAEARRNAGLIEYFVDIDEGLWEEAIERTQNFKNSDIDALASAAANALYLADQFDDALAVYERLIGLVREGQPIWGQGAQLETMRLAVARRILGDENGAQHAADIVRRDQAALRKAGRDNQWIDLKDAMLAAFDNDQDGVIKALKASLDNGLHYRSVFHDPVFADLQDAPRFVALRQELETKMAAEREKVLQLICFDDPVLGDWEPLPETCEGVVQTPELEPVSQD